MKEKIDRDPPLYMLAFYRRGLTRAANQSKHTQTTALLGQRHTRFTNTHQTCRSQHPYVTCAYSNNCSDSRVTTMESSLFYFNSCLTAPASWWFFLPFPGDAMPLNPSILFCGAPKIKPFKVIDPGSASHLGALELSRAPTGSLRSVVCCVSQ